MASAINAMLHGQHFENVAMLSLLQSFVLQSET